MVYFHQGGVVELNANSGFIKTPQDPQLFFDLSEVMDDAKLTLSEKVEFTLAVVSALGYYVSFDGNYFFAFPNTLEDLYLT